MKNKKRIIKCKKCDLDKSLPKSADAGQVSRHLSLQDETNGPRYPLLIKFNLQLQVSERC